MKDSLIIVSGGMDSVILLYEKKGIDASEYYVQPCDVQDEKRNAEILKAMVGFVEKHPVWQFSLQQQKIINVL